MHSTPSSTLGQLTGPPFISLVDVDGYAVPVGEKDVPHAGPDPSDPADWPASADNWFWETGPELGPVVDAFELTMDALEASDPAPAGLLEAFHVLPVADGAPEPTAEDLEDFAAWSAELDRRYAAAEASRTPTVAEMRAWYDAHEHDRPGYDPAA